MKLIELDNRLKGGSTVPHLMLRILVDKTVCQLKLILNYDIANYIMLKYIQQLIESKYFSLITNLKVINENITT